jgi:bifunctional DNA-binding transcriptional regulator/antitoxin component of YhaV-PrlF toxin-antitoxin module
MGDFLGNTTTVGMSKRGQFFCSIPKGIAEAMRLKRSDKLEFVFDRGDVLVRKL